MSLSAVLVDRARLLRKGAQPLKVEGRTQFVDTEPGTWFACRLSLPTAPESYDPATVRKRVVIVPTILYDLEDDQDNEVLLNASDMLEIESDDLGNATWQVTANPEPLRRREGLVGWQVALRRVQSVEFEPKI